VPLGARVLFARVLLFGTGGLQTVVGARTVVAVWLAGTTALGAGAYSVTRAMCRDFDVEVGRPTRPRADALRSWSRRLAASLPVGAGRSPRTSERSYQSKEGN
jgi:hypothetical protein